VELTWRKQRENKVKMFEIFEESAKEYDDWFNRHELAYRSELAAVKTLMPQAGRGLEIGVGTGRFAAPLAIKIGVEPARSMSEIAQSRGLEVIRAYAEALPFPDHSFDVVLMVTVLCFLADPFNSILEATRVLKPRGHLVIAMIDPDTPLGQSYENNKEKSKFYRQAKFIRVSRVLKWFGQLGYPNINVLQTIFKDPATITDLEPVKKNYGEGVFVVIAGEKLFSASAFRSYAT
jgi:ubiquinone/menaquinone biosynthesis C-methylase UbiE